MSDQPVHFSLVGSLIVIGRLIVRRNSNAYRTFEHVSTEMKIWFFVPGTEIFSISYRTPRTKQTLASLQPDGDRLRFWKLMFLIGDRFRGSATNIIDFAHFSFVRQKYYIKTYSDRWTRRFARVPSAPLPFQRVTRISAARLRQHAYHDFVATQSVCAVCAMWAAPGAFVPRRSLRSSINPVRDT